MKLICTIMMVAALTISLKAQDYKNTIADKAQNITLRLYPLPAKNYINMYITAKKPQYITIKLFDDNHPSQLSEWKEMINTNYEKDVDITKLPNGKYHVEIDHVNGSLKKYFTVAR